MEVNKILQGDSLEVLKTLDDESVDMCITSPPYWALRDYGVEGQLGLEPTFQEYINRLCDIFDEVKRVLKKEGTCWVNMGDTYASSGSQRFDDKPMGKNPMVQGRGRTNDVQSKSLIQIPSRFAIEMTNRGWILRNEIIWYKPNCMPSSADDRFTVDFEKIFFFTKNKKYYFETQYEKSLTNENRPDGIVRDRIYDYDSKQKIITGRTAKGGDGSGELGSGVRFGDSSLGRNKRCIWKINTKPYSEAHFATYPEELIETPIKAGCPKGGVVLDIFMGSGTTAKVARYLGRNYLGIELNAEYIKLAEKRLAQQTLL